MSLYPINSVWSRIFLQKLIFVQVGMEFHACLCTPNLQYWFRKVPYWFTLWATLIYMTWHDISICVLKFKKKKMFWLVIIIHKICFYSFVSHQLDASQYLINTVLTYLLLKFEPQCHLTQEPFSGHPFSLVCYISLNPITFLSITYSFTRLTHFYSENR